MSRGAPAWLVALAIALMTTTDRSSNAQPAAQPNVYNVARDAVFRVEAQSCNDLPSSKARAGAAFAVDDGHAVRIVTALHVVVRCTKLLLWDSSNHFGTTAIVRQLPASDLAMLDVPKAPPGVPYTALTYGALKVGTTAPSAGQQLTAIGFGNNTPAAFPKTVEVSKLSFPTLQDLLRAAGLSAAPAALTQQGYPLPASAIVPFTSAFYKGDSGAPIIDDSGAVLAIANGGFFLGAQPFTWGMPVSAVSSLSTSTATASAGATSMSELLVSDVIDVAPNASAPSQPTLAPGVVVRCGSESFRKTLTRTLDQVLSSADPLSNAQAMYVVNFAQANGRPMNRSDNYDVYLSERTGASFVLFSGFTLASGRDCVARDAANQIEVKVTLEVTPTPLSIQAASSAFEQRTVRPGEMPGPLQNFTMWQPITRTDGMMVRRAGYYYMQLGGAYTEGYVSHVAKSGTYMGVVTRSLVGAVGVSNAAWFPALMSTYTSAYSF